MLTEYTSRISQFCKHYHALLNLTKLSKKDGRHKQHGKRQMTSTAKLHGKRDVPRPVPSHNPHAQVNIPHAIELRNEMLDMVGQSTLAQRCLDVGMRILFHIICPFGHVCWVISCLYWVMLRWGQCDTGSDFRVIWSQCARMCAVCICRRVQVYRPWKIVNCGEMLTVKIELLIVNCGIKSD